MPGNPFKSSKDAEGGLLGGEGGLRSDQWDDHDLDQPVGAAVAGSAATGAAAGAAAASAAASEAAQRAGAAPAVAAAEAPLPPPPPPIATASFIPPPLATQPPTIGVPASTAGAWGAAQPAQQPGVWGVSSSQFDSSGPAGFPPPAGAYGAGAPGAYGAPGYQPQQWTGGYSDQPLTCACVQSCCAGRCGELHSLCCRCSAATACGMYCVSGCSSRSQAKASLLSDSAADGWD